MLYIEAKKERRQKLSLGLLERNNMKKILIILICLYIGNVKALEYSDYTPFSDYTDKEIKADELTDVKIERRYKYYKLVREEGPYEKENIVNEDYPYIDNNDYTYTSESPYLNEPPAEQKDRIITTHTLYHHLKADDITYIKFNNNSNTDLTYSSLNLVYKGENINYSTIYKNANGTQIKAGGEIEIKFTEKIDVRYLTITCDITPFTNNRADLYITLGNDRLKVGHARYTFLTADITNIKINGINIDTYSNAFVDYYSDKIEQTRPTIHYHDTVIKYTYKDTIYRKYNLKREYNEEYSNGPIENYIYKDEEQYKDYYAYRTRQPINQNIISKPNNSNQKNYIILKTPSVNKVFLKASPPTQINHNLKPNTNNPYLIKNYVTHKNPNYVNKKTLKQNTFISYFNYILIIIVILILVLSKLYKKYRKRVMV